MKITKVTLCAAISVGFLLTGCRTRQEASGDKYRKAGDPLHALMQYEEAIKRGKLSKEFWKNYTLVNIQAMALRSKEDPTAEFLDVLRDTVSNYLVLYPDPENQALFVKTVTEIADKRMKIGSPEAVEGGFRFLAAAEKAGGGSATDSYKTQIVAGKLKEIESDMKDNGDGTAGIVADYKMNKLALMIGGETSEMQSLWSRIRKENLKTYLMYDNDEVVLGERPDARINKYGVLLAILKYTPGSTSTSLQVKAWNGSSGPIQFKGNAFTLVDTEGNAYEPSAKIGGFAKSDKEVVGKTEESKTGGLTFKHPSGAKPAYLEFKTGGGSTRKYLP